MRSRFESTSNESDPVGDSPGVSGKSFSVSIIAGKTVF
jgi:hypothetical protein